jgi:RNA polymerase sigma factor (sigma-70 family)
VPTTNKEDLNQIFSEIRVRLSAVAQYRIRDEKIREDVVQETMLVLAEKYQSLPSKGGALAFALQILRNKIGDCYRQQHRAQRTLVEIDAVDGRNPERPTPMELLAGGLRPDEILEKDEIHDRVRKAIDQLGLECQRIFLGLLEEKSRTELARELNKSMEALYKQLSRCAEQLRNLLKGTP